MAAFCTCCGAEITLKAEVCPVCGSPQHGMAQPDPLDDGVDSARENAKSGRKLRDTLSERVS
jgi:predicted amidophosphoribosyltransferase